MRIVAANTAGFCFGVRKALDLVLDAARDCRTVRPPHGSIPEAGTASVRRDPDPSDTDDELEDVRLCTLGPLVHNNQALEALEVRGVRAVEGLDDVRGGTVVVRAHGAGPRVRAEMRARNLDVIDATCPRVVRCQRAVERAASAGRQIVIAGDADHAEVVALVDFAEYRGGDAAKPTEVFSTVERAASVQLSPPVTLVAQTTFNSTTYGEIAGVLRQRLADSGEAALEVVNSLCRSTEERQSETEALAGGVDAVVIVGGRHSANTRRLVEVAERSGKPVFHVETADELQPAEFAGVSVVGVSAGASTPAWITESVAERLVEIGSPARRLLHRVARALLGSNVLLAAGAASITYAATGVIRTAADPRALFLAFAYVFFAYATNRAREDKWAGFAPGGHIRFFNAHRRGILAAGWILTVSALALGFSTNTRVGLAFLGAVLFAALYSIRLVPARLVPRGVARLRDIPGSKDFFVALAMAYVAVLLPYLALADSIQPWPESYVAAASVFLLGFAAATALELGDVHSDRLMGRESVAVLLGYDRARVLVAAGAAIVLLVMAVVVHFDGELVWRPVPAAYGLAASALGVVFATVKPRVPGDSLSQALAIQLSLLAAGPIAYLATLCLGR